MDDDGCAIISDAGDYDSLTSVRIFQQLLLKERERAVVAEQMFCYATNSKQIAVKQLMYSNWKITNLEGI